MRAPFPARRPRPSACAPARHNRGQSQLLYYYYDNETEANWIFPEPPASPPLAPMPLFGLNGTNATNALLNVLMLYPATKAEYDLAPLPDLLVWPTYYVGQFLIATGVVQTLRRFRR